MHSLTPKQKRFVDEYLVDLSATRAAKRAGFSPQNAGKIGSQLLGKTRIKEAIRVEQDRRAVRTGIRQEAVLAALAAIAFADPRDFVDSSYKPPRLRPLSQLTNAQLHALKRARPLRNGFELVLHDKTRALDLLGRHLGLW